MATEAVLGAAPFVIRLYSGIYPPAGGAEAVAALQTRIQALEAALAALLAGGGITPPVFIPNVIYLNDGLLTLDDLLLELA